jgi:hypothetical protein
MQNNIIPQDINFHQNFEQPNIPYDEDTMPECSCIKIQSHIKNCPVCKIIHKKPKICYYNLLIIILLLIIIYKLYKN